MPNMGAVPRGNLACVRDAAGVRHVAPTRASAACREPTGLPPNALAPAGRALVRRPLRIAVLDRDPGFLLVLAKRVQDRGWEHSALEKAPTPERLVAMRLDAVVLDVAILGTGGWRWIKELGEKRDRLAIVVCTGASTAAQRVRALHLGVDDWLGKPCHPEELIARVEAVVRQRGRLELSSFPPNVVGELEIRFEDYQAYAGGVSLEFTRLEFQMIELFARWPDTKLKRELIYERLWGGDMPREERSVDVLVHKVRRKLQRVSPRWSYIHTHHAVGYSFSPRPRNLEVASSLDDELRDDRAA